MDKSGLTESVTTLKIEGKADRKGLITELPNTSVRQT